MVISSCMKKAFILISILILLTPMTLAQEITYYFQDDRHPQFDEMKLLSQTPPTSSASYAVDLDEGAMIWATPPFSNEMKINGDVKTTIFIEAFFINPDLLPIQLRVIKLYLVDISPTGNVAIIDDSRPYPILFFGNETIQDFSYTFNNVEYVIGQGHCLGIKVEKVFDLMSYFPFSMLSSLFATYVLYGSQYTKSFVRIPFNITQEGISVECYPQQKSVKAGDSVSYGLIIYNNGNEKEEVEVSTNYAGNEWQVIINPTKLTIEPNSFNYTDVEVIAPKNATEGEYLNITIFVNGKYGSDSIWLNTTIAPPEYGVKVVALTKDVEAKPGETAKFKFKVENTGDLTDTYTLNVTCVWDYSLERDKVILDAGESINVSVFVQVPENATNGTTQIVALTAKSVNSAKESTATAKVKVVYVTPPPKEKEGNLLMIAYILFVVGVVALLGAAAYLSMMTQKMAIVGCEERFAEIPPGGTAEFTVKIKNPLEKKEKNRIRYKLRIEGKLPENWKAEVERDEIVLEGKEEKEVKVRVRVPKEASLEEWASLDFVVIPQKGKSEKIDLLVTLREPKEILNVSYENEPEEPKEGERVITKVKIENVGEKDAENKKVILLVNGREKNRIEGINIPAGGKAEIEIPWIAEEENEVEVKVE